MINLDKKNLKPSHVEKILENGKQWDKEVGAAIVIANDVCSPSYLGSCPSRGVWEIPSWDIDIALNFVLSWKKVLPAKQTGDEVSVDC